MRYSASKKWRDLENWVRGCSRSLKTAPFDRSHTTFYWFAIVTIALSCTVLSYLTLNNIVTLKSGLELRGHSRSFKLVPFESLGAVSYSPSIATMALSCISCEKKRAIGRTSWFFHNPVVFDAPVRGSQSEYCHPVWCGKTRIDGYPTVKRRWWYV